MATQEDMYRESQKTRAALDRQTKLIEKAEAKGLREDKQFEARMKKHDETKKELEEANNKAERREEIERRLLGQTEKQYDEMLEIIQNGPIAS